MRLKLATLTAVVCSAARAYADEAMTQTVVVREPTIVHKIVDFITENAVKYSFQVLGGLVILFGAWMISRVAVRMAHQALRARKIDITIEKFLLQALRILILGLGVLLALSSFGVQIAPLIAGLSVAGVGIGLAIQGPLANYAAGATLIFTKPFKVGDIIEVKGYQGEVRDIALPRTELNGIDGSIIVIPNKHIIGEVIKNFSEYRKLEINVGVGYESNVQKALDVLEHIIKTEKRIPSREKYKVGIKDFGDSAIILELLVWVPQADYLDVKFAINKDILTEFASHQISIPYPQRDVHIYQK